jgi:hypothetical protein
MNILFVWYWKSFPYQDEITTNLAMLIIVLFGVLGVFLSNEGKHKVVLFCIFILIPIHFIINNVIPGYILYEYIIYNFRILYFCLPFTIIMYLSLLLLRFMIEIVDVENIIKISDGVSELNREDGVLIDVFSFIQGMLTIRYGLIYIIILIIFIIPRSIGHIKNNNKYRLISSVALIPLIYIDIYFLFNQYINLENYIQMILNFYILPKEIVDYYIFSSVIIMSGIFWIYMGKMFQIRYNESIKSIITEIRDWAISVTISV